MPTQVTTQTPHELVPFVDILPGEFFEDEHGELFLRLPDRHTGEPVVLFVRYESGEPVEPTPRFCGYWSSHSRARVMVTLTTGVTLTITG